MITSKRGEWQRHCLGMVDPNRFFYFRLRLGGMLDADMEYLSLDGMLRLIGRSC